MYMEEEEGGGRWYYGGLSREDMLCCSKLIVGVYQIFLVDSSTLIS